MSARSQKPTRTPSLSSGGTQVVQSGSNIADHSQSNLYSSQSTCSHQLFQPCNQFHHLPELHVAFKHVQSLLSDQRHITFDTALNAFDIHICAIAATWAKHADEHFAIASGHDVYLSGCAPDGPKGVGFVICNQIRNQLSSIIFCATPRTRI